MLKRILLRVRDMRTLGKLIPGADKHANSMGESKPGAEHFVLSALDLDDDTARHVFEKIGVDSEKFKSAIAEQYQRALSSVGISQEAVGITSEPVESEKIFLESKPSGKELMKSLYALKKKDKYRPLLGVHVIIVAAAIKHGVVPRALHVLGIDREILAKAGREELQNYGGNSTY